MGIEYKNGKYNQGNFHIYLCESNLELLRWSYLHVWSEICAYRDHNEM